MYVNVSNRVVKAWYEMLVDVSGPEPVSRISVPVYCIDAPASETGNYYLIRPESDTDKPNNHKFINNPVVITEAVTKFHTMIDYALAGEIDEEAASLLFPGSVAQHALPAQDDIQIISVQRRDATYLPEDDGTNRFLRLITRNVHRVEQLVNQS